MGLRQIRGFLELGPDIILRGCSRQRGGRRCDRGNQGRVRGAALRVDAQGGDGAGRAGSAGREGQPDSHVDLGGRRRRAWVRGGGRGQGVRVSLRWRRLGADAAERRSRTRAGGRPRPRRCPARLRPHGNRRAGKPFADHGCRGVGQLGSGHVGRDDQQLPLGRHLRIDVRRRPTRRRTLLSAHGTSGESDRPAGQGDAAQGSGTGAAADQAGDADAVQGRRDQGRTDRRAAARDPLERGRCGDRLPRVGPGQRDQPARALHVARAPLAIAMVRVQDQRPAARAVAQLRPAGNQVVVGSDDGRDGRDAWPRSARVPIEAHHPSLSWRRSLPLPKARKCSSGAAEVRRRRRHRAASSAALVSACRSTTGV